MTLSEVIQLIGAGYTKADIDAMEAQDQIEDPMPVEQKAAPAEAPAPAPAPAAPASDPALLEAIKTLTAAVQHSNVLSTAQPSGIVPEDVQKQADDILAKFCNT